MRSSWVESCLACAYCTFVHLAFPRLAPKASSEFQGALSTRSAMILGTRARIAGVNGGRIDWKAAGNRKVREHAELRQCLNTHTICGTLANTILRSTYHKKTREDSTSSPPNSQPYDTEEAAVQAWDQSVPRAHWEHSSENLAR